MKKTKKKLQVHGIGIAGRVNITQFQIPDLRRRVGSTIWRKYRRTAQVLDVVLL